ncbi:GNAT family N-acetyltransferase [Candidatus Thorarchaeota archaeon]|nr:MAG: GNAT family N-acetyltransferase [Candidatus Thorarchaeota archaeon]
MNDLTIRPVRLDDVERIVEIEESSFSPPWEEDIFYQIAKNRGRFRVDDDIIICMNVMFQNSLVIGYIVWEEDYDANSGHILNIAINQPERCKGYGMKLLETTLRSMMESRLETCELEVKESNRWARHLYEKAGMMAVDKIVEYYDGEDAIIYEIIFE